MDGHGRFRLVVGMVSVCVVMTAWLLQGTWTDASATTIYSYTDESGNAVYTDDLRKVPEKHRGTVQQFEQKSGQSSVGEKIKSFGSKFRSVGVSIDGMSPEQSTVLNYAGGAAVFLLIVMYLSKESPMVRLLALGILIVIAIATPVLIYSGEGGALNVMKEKANEAANINDKRLQQVAPH